jgi:hypothetical protein
MSARFEFPRQFAIVIDLAVEYDGDGSVTTGHRLVTPSKVNDRKSPHAKRDFACDHYALIVGPAVRDDATHPFQHFARLASVAVRLSGHESGDATHVQSSVQPVKARPEVVFSLTGTSFCFFIARGGTRSRIGSQLA